MGKQKAIGGLLFIAAIFLIIYYSYMVFLVHFGIHLPFFELIEFPEFTYWGWALPLWIAVIIVMGVASWIGWTMLTTPPPEPLENFDFTEENEEEEKTEKKNE